MIPSRPCTFSSLEVSCGIVVSLDHLRALAVVFTVLVNGNWGIFGPVHVSFIIEVCHNAYMWKSMARYRGEMLVRINIFSADHRFEYQVQTMSNCCV